MAQQGPLGISSGHHPHPGKGVHAFLSVVISLKWPHNALYNLLVSGNAKVLYLLPGKSAVSPGGSDQGSCHRAKRAGSLYSKRPFYTASWLKRKFKYTFSVPSSFVNGSCRASVFQQVHQPCFSLHVLKYQPSRPSLSNCARPKVLALGLRWPSKGE